MNRLLLILPMLCVGLAGCADAPPPDLLPGPHVTIGFPAGNIVNVIKIEAVDIQPLRAAELVAPDGKVTAASFIDVQRNQQASSGQYPTDSFRHTPTFADTGPLIPNVNSAATYRSQDTLLLITADAEITVPDPVVYRRDWQHYKIRLTYGAEATPDVREVAAPAPPPRG